MTGRHEPASADGLAHPAAIEEALAAFRRDYPAFEGTSVLDDLRVRDYARLDAGGHIYLDYTGGGLYGESQLARHHELLANSIFGNPPCTVTRSPTRPANRCSAPCCVIGRATFALAPWTIHHLTYVAGRPVMKQSDRSLVWSASSEDITRQASLL